MHTQYQGYHKKEKSDFLFFPLWSLILVAVTNGTLMSKTCYN